MNAYDTLRFSVGMAGVAMILSSTQVVCAPAVYKAGGAFDPSAWPVGRRFRRVLTRLTIPLDHRVVRAVATTRVLVAGGLMVPLTPPEILIVLAAGGLILNRLHMMFSGRFVEWGEQMVTVVLGAAVFGWLGNSETSLTLSLFAITAQAMLLYAGGGILKGLTPSWRTGEALWKILCQQVGGHPALGHWLRRHPRWALFFAWATIFWESVLPILLVAPPPVLYAGLTIGVVFHFAVAYAMGFSTYTWPFFATYPAIVFTNTIVRGWWL